MSTTSVLTDSSDGYRQRWSWDKVTWGTHCLNCLATCNYRVYSKDGKVLFEEQGGSIETIESKVPDLNPLGCQKGSAWSQQLYSEDRILYPLRRVGERGESKFEKISWDEALTEIAHSIVDTLDEFGPESIVFEESVEGGLLSQSAFLRFASQIGAITLDAQGLVNDLPIGHHITFGKFSCASTVDDTFKSDLLLLWHSNPAYTSIPYHHFITEARYRGAQVVTVAPDYSASAVNSDLYVPVTPGTDAALALSICQVMISENIFNRDFISEQTDLSLLIRLDNNRFLRERDIKKGGGEETFYFLDQNDVLTEVSKKTLELNGVVPKLEGTADVTLADGIVITVTPVFAVLKNFLEEYEPEKASQICGVSPKVIRHLATLIASKKTKILEGFNAAKYYHGDLMERAMCLCLALSGNWGIPGTGIQGLALAGLDGYMLFSMKRKAGVEETARLLDGIDMAVDQMRQKDPEATDEMLGNQMLSLSVASGTSAPPFFFNYHHVGYRDIWNKSEWSDSSMSKTFTNYFDDAMRRGWWGGVAKPSASNPPKMMFLVGTNPIRRARGGRERMVNSLWTKLDKVVTVDFRMSSTALMSDIILPAAMQYERVNVQYPITHTLRLSFSDKAVEPRGEAKTEWEIFSLLCEKLTEVAAERNLVEYLDGKRQVRKLDKLLENFTMDGAFEKEDAIIDEWVRDSADAGTLPMGSSIDTLKEAGSIRFAGLGIFAPGLSVAADVDKDKVMTAFGWHVKNKLPFPTLTKRAQFYIDHPWFIEANEMLPIHKDNPHLGGEYPFVLTSGHSRWTVHAVSMGNKSVLSTHRGQPLVVMSSVDAANKNLEDGQFARVFNDYGSFKSMIKIATRVRPGQLIIYNGFEPHMFSEWKGSNEVEPGMVKWLHMVGKYGHLRYLPFGWQPVPADRAISVDIELADKDELREET